MSHAQEASSGINESDLAASDTPGYKIGQKKTLDEYNQLDAEDESLQKWKASLGITATATTTSTGPKVEMISLSLLSDSRPEPIIFDLTNLDALNAKKTSINIKEGAEYAVELKFRIQTLVTGLKYLQVVRRAGINVDKLETMIGSYGPSPDPISKKFVNEEAPSGMLARSGTYAVRSRVVDDDKNVYCDFSWEFKLTKQW